MEKLKKRLLSGLFIGAVSFAADFVLMILLPFIINGGNQSPLLGILLAIPVSFLGFIVGLFMNVFKDN